MDYKKEIELFLIDREKRVYHQEEILKSKGGLSLVTVRINYPGLEKSNYVTDSIVKIICNEISLFYKNYIVFREEYKSREGCIGHFIFNIEPLILKKYLIELEENHILGRCVDLDVYYLNKSGMENSNELKGVSRRDIGKSFRKCFICEEDAIICSRLQKHELEEIKEFFEMTYNRYILLYKKREKISNIVANMALKAIISEVSTIPSFGLVSPTTTGSHNDMDYYTFLDSSFAITPFLKEMFYVGYSFRNSEEIFKTIRLIGRECEKTMFEVTKGVNTHKGMIFLMGVTIASIGKVIYEKKSFNDIEAILKDMCKDILDDFNEIDKKDVLTNGEKLYIKYGFKGVRGEVASGLSVIFEKVLPEYLNSDLKGHKLYAHTLLRLMSILEDSTIVHRHDINKLRYIQFKAKEILSIGGFKTQLGIDMAIKFELECIEDNISPGGSADLLAITIFLGEIKNYFNSLNNIK